MASNSSTNPRIHFKGKYVADVPTSNNDHGQNIDVGTLALYIKRPDGSLQANYTDEEFLKWQADAVLNYQANAGYWNLNGSNSFWWEDTKVTSVEIDGNVVNDPQMVGVSVELLGHLLHGNRTKPKMVDLDMSGIYTSQIFSGELRLGGLSGQVPVLVGSDPSVAHNRIFNFNQISVVQYPKTPYVPKNEGCSGSFKFVIDKQKLALDNETVKSSPVLRAMKKALDEGRADGISVRYLLFNTIHPTVWQTLKTLDRPPTPAYGSVYGTIELWNYRDEPKAPVYEPMGVPAGRLLTYKDPIPGGDPNNPQTLSPSWIKVDEKRGVLTMDMLATVPFSNRDDSKYWAVAGKFGNLDASLVPTLGPKVNFGEFKLCLKIKDAQGNAKSIEIGNIPYDNNYYNARNGIAEISFLGKATVQQVREGEFVAVAKDKTGKSVTLLEEEPVTFNSDQLDIYLDHKETTDLTFHAYRYGKPWANQPVYIFQYFNPDNFPDNDLQFADSAEGTVEKPQVVTFDPFCPFYRPGIVGQVTTDEKGVGVITIQGTLSGAAQLLFLSELPKDHGFVKRENWDDVFWVGVRVLPNDSHLLRAPLEERISWDFVKKNILRYYYLVFPTMATRFSLIDPNEVKTKGFMIAEMINKRNFEKTWFMPVTREMSAAKRRILSDYILAQRPDVTPVTPVVPVPQPESHPYDAHFAIKTRDQLLYALTIAADQEQGLMLQYLFGAWSLKQPEEMMGWPKERVEKVNRWRNTIIEVAKQEMLHLGYVMNLVNAVGGSPHFFDINFPQNKNYFSPGIQFKLTKFSIDTIRRFSKFEQPYEAIVADWLFHMSKKYEAVKRELINQVKQQQAAQQKQVNGNKPSLISSVKNDDGSEEIEFKDNSSKSSLSNSTRKKSGNKDARQQSSKAQQQAPKEPAVEDQMRETWMAAVRDPDVRALIPSKEWIDLNPQQRQEWIIAYRRFSQIDQNKSFLLRGVQEYRKHVDLNQLFATTQPYPTISTLYEQLRKVFETEAIPNLFLGPQSAQVYGFFKEQQAKQFGHLGPIRTAKDAVSAVDLIIEQGEGGPEFVVENGEFIPRKDSHFGKFMHILDEITHEDKTWFDQAVRPVVSNPATRVHEDNLGEQSQVTLIKRDEVPLTFYTMVIFNAVYETMLLVLYRFFGSSDNSSTDTTTLYKLFSPLMKSILSPLADLLTVLPADRYGLNNAGPSFEVLKSSNYMPFRHVAFEIIKERLDQITEAVSFLLTNFKDFNAACARGNVPLRKAPPPLKGEYSGAGVVIEQERPSLIPDDREKNILQNSIGDYAVSNSPKSFLVQDKLEEIHASLLITLQSFNAIEQDTVRTTPVTASGALNN